MGVTPKSKESKGFNKPEGAAFDEVDTEESKGFHEEPIFNRDGDATGKRKSGRNAASHTCPLICAQLHTFLPETESQYRPLTGLNEDRLMG